MQFLAIRWWSKAGENVSDQSDKPAKLDVRHFWVANIEKTTTPAGMTGGENCYRYTIGEGESAIHGIRAGSLKAVTAYAEEFAANLNERTLLGYSAYAARRLQK